MSETIREVPWYVVYTKPRKERQVAMLLANKRHLTVYLPEVLQRYRHKIQLHPLFPRYLFVQIGSGELELTPIDSTPGAIGLVMAEHKPLPLRPSIVTAIQEEVERLNKIGGLLAESFKEGDLVRIKTGPLAGLEAVFIKQLSPRDRAIVLIRFLGRENRTEVAISELIGRKPKRDRGTRGRQRKIRIEETQQ